PAAIAPASATISRAAPLASPPSLPRRGTVYRTHSNGRGGPPFVRAHASWRRRKDRWSRWSANRAWGPARVDGAAASKRRVAVGPGVGPAHPRPRQPIGSAPSVPWTSICLRPRQANRGSPDWFRGWEAADPPRRGAARPTYWRRGTAAGRYTSYTVRCP